MGQSYGVADASFLLREYYSEEYQRAPQLMYSLESHTFFGQIPKNPKIEGKYIPMPLIFAPPAGRSSNFATAVANAQTLAGTAFQIPTRTDYIPVYVDGRTLALAATNKGAFL